MFPLFGCAYIIVAYVVLFVIVNRLVVVLGMWESDLSWDIVAHSYVRYLMWFYTSSTGADCQSRSEITFEEFFES